MTPKSTAFRQILSLDPTQTPSVPNLSEVPDLIGPITDLLTFYSDLWLAIRQGNLHNEGDHFFTETNMPASWADGTYITLGESAIDFDVTLVAIDRVKQSAKLLVLLSFLLPSPGFQAESRRRARTYFGRLAR